MPTVEVRVCYRNERVTDGSRMFLYGDPRWSDLSWAGTPAGGHESGALSHPYDLPNDCGLERSVLYPIWPLLFHHVSPNTVKIWVDLAEKSGHLM